MDDAFERGNYAGEELRKLAAGDEDIVDFEQHAEAVAFAGELLLISLRRFQIERVVHGYRYLARDALHELQFRVGSALRDRVAEAQSAEAVLRGGQRNNHHGAYAVSAQALAEPRKAGLFLKVTNHVGLLILPDPAGRRILDAHFCALMFLDQDAALENVQAHHVLRWVVKDQSEEVEVNDGVQSRGKVVKQRRKIALLRNSLAYFEQGFELSPGVLQRRSMRHFRRRDDPFRHRRQDNTRKSDGSTAARAGHPKEAAIAETC